MVDTLTNIFQRDWNLFNSDANDYNDNSNNNSVRQQQQQRSLTKKPSDNNNSSDYERHLSVNDYEDVPSSPNVRTPKPLSNRRSLDTAYDTDGAVRTPGNISKHHHRHHHFNSSNNYEHLISPRLPVRPSNRQSTRQAAGTPDQHQLSHRNRPAGTPSLANNHNRDDHDEDSGYEADGHRRQIRLSRRVQQTPTPNGNHGLQNRPASALSHRATPRIVTPSVQPLRIIFMRHGERANQALGPDWFNRAFRTNTYKPYDENLPDYLPKRRFERAYEFDAPLTVRGLKTARLTGRSLMNHHFLADICLSSTALRCVQTCERILTGMDRRDRIPIRIEPGLFECPHVNPKIVDSFMTKKELMENRYNIKQDYEPLVSKVNVPETLDEYFERSALVMRGIIERYGRQGGIVLIVTHAPGILALTNALKGTKSNVETFYRTVAAYPPLATYIAEHDGTKWRYSDKPFNLVPT